MKRRPHPAEMRRRTSAFLEAMTPPERRDRIPANLRAENVPAKRERAAPRKLEAPILKAILQAFKMHPKVALVDRRNSGMIHGEGVHIFLGRTGTLDLSGMMKGSGRYFEVEVKAPGNKPSEAQLLRIEGIRLHGGIAGWATSVDEALKILEG